MLPPAEYSKAADSRLYARQKVLLSCLKLNNDNGGVILDISEQGLALQAARCLGEAPYTQLRFQLSQSEDWIEARGRIAWKSPSKQTAGVEFVDLPFESLVLIKNWISSITLLTEDPEESVIPEAVVPPQPMLVVAEGATNVVSIVEPEPKADLEQQFLQGWPADTLAGISGRAQADNPPLEAPREAVKREAVKKDAQKAASSNVIPGELFSLSLRRKRLEVPGPLNRNVLRAASRRRRRMRFPLIAALLFPVLIVAAYVGRNIRGNQTDERPASSLRQPQAGSNGASGYVTSAYKPQASPDTSGFILQVAAMANEKSALSFADSLRQKNFSAFVFKPAMATLYRVLVGPYSDAESAASGEAALRLQGFEPILKRNVSDQ